MKVSLISLYLSLSLCLSLHQHDNIQTQEQSRKCRCHQSLVTDVSGVCVESTTVALNGKRLRESEGEENWVGESTAGDPDADDQLRSVFYSSLTLGIRIE
jgi:hypothetical protein